MKKQNKLMMINFVIAILAVVLYLAITPHTHIVEKIISKNYEATIATIPFTANELINGSIRIFVVLMLPTIIYLAKKYAKIILLGKKNTTNA